MPKVTALQYGHPLRAADGIVGFCTTVLIEGEKRTLVDTGHVGRRNDLKASLLRVGLEPGDIDSVVLTHAHWDHSQNLDLFPDAEVLLHPAERKYSRAPHVNDWATPQWTGSMLEHHKRLREVEEGFEVESRVTVMHTPGHSPGCLTVLAETDDGVAAMTGDVLHYGTVALTKVNPLVFWSESEAVASIDRILGVADIIYPGHDRPFKVVGNKIEYQAAPILTLAGLAPDDQLLAWDASDRVPWVMPGIEGQRERLASL